MPIEESTWMMVSGIAIGVMALASFGSKAIARPFVWSLLVGTFLTMLLGAMWARTPVGLWGGG